MLDTQTKKRIDDCRDILVGKLPDPKAQIEQITIGLIYKFMDDMDKEAVELGGSAKFFSDFKIPDPEFPNDRSKEKTVEFSKYSWDKLFDTKVTASEMLRLYSEAIESMEKNPNIPQLFRDIFNNAYLPYRDPETLKMFLKTIDEFEYTHSEKLGDAFEYLLSVMGSQGDAGQFRTPRHIIDFLVAIIDPDKGDTILDPACGTAGFLISAYKHILLKHTKANQKKDGRSADVKDSAHVQTQCIASPPYNIFTYHQLKDEDKFPLNHELLTPDDRKKLIQNFAGYDISPDMVRLSLVNLYLHGFSDPHINEYDTLSSEDRWNENFDVVLANPPFMSPKGGIRPHKKFTISSNRSEVLFVDYIAEHLNPKGKAGIIVPEGVIFQSGKAYKDLRKMVVENYLYAVVSLPAGVFNPYSGVKTSILLMDKAIAKQRNEILFVKIDNDGYNLGAQRAAVKGSQLEEALKIIHDFGAEGTLHETSLQSSIAHVVLKADIAANGDYYLSGERYRLAEDRKSDFPIVSLGDFIKVDNGRVLTEFQETGEIACVKVSDMNLPENNLEIVTTSHWLKETSYPLLPINSIVFPKRGAAIATNKKRFTKIPCLIDNNCMGITVMDEERLNPKYLFAFMNQFDLSSISNSAGIALINNPDIKGVQIPLPSLSIQEEIVAEIGGYQKIIDGAKAVVANYKPKIDIDPDWEMVELGEVCNVKSGGTPSRKEDTYWNGDIPWVGSTVCKDVYVDSAGEYITESGLQNSSAKILEVGTTLIALVGATIGKTGFLTFDCTTNQNIAGLLPKDESNLDRTYLYFACQSIYNNFLRLGEGKFRMATLGFVREQKIALPPLETQRQIVAQIEKEQALVNANKELIEIFEQKIKERIGKVWGTSTSAVQDEKTVEENLNMAAERVAEYEKA